MIVAFDIDDTIYRIREDEKDQVPDYDLIQFLRWFASNGDTVIVWSAGGVDYANMIVKKLGLDRIVTVAPKGNHPGLKPDITFDDMVVTMGKANVLVNRGKTIEELYGDV